MIRKALVVDVPDDVLKSRMDHRLGQLQWSLVDLAERTGENYRNVHRWIREDVKVPAHFVARYVEAVPVSPRWLLTGEGGPDPVTPSTAERALERIAHVLDSVRLTSSTGRLADSVIRSSVDGILAFDPEYRYTLWNPAMERISGFTAAEVLGRVAFDVFPFLEGIGEREFFDAALAGREAVAPDRPFLPRGGVRGGWFEGYYSPLRDGAGEVVGGLAVVRDVSERRETEGLLRESQERYRDLVEMSPDAILVQRDGVIEYANLATEQLLRCPRRGELTGLHIRELIPPEEWEWRSTVIQEIAEGKRVGPLPRTLLRRDGAAVQVEIRAVGVRWGGTTGTQAVIREISPG